MIPSNCVKIVASQIMSRLKNEIYLKESKTMSKVKSNEVLTVSVNADNQLVINPSDVMDSSTIVTNPMDDLIADVATIKNDAFEFIALPCYPLLLSVSANLLDSIFTPSKDNTNPLKGSFPLFSESNYTGNSLQAMDIPKIDFNALIALKFAVVVDDLKVSEYNAYLEQIKADRIISALVADINNLKSLFLSESLRVRYANYQRVKTFLSGKSADDFIVDECLDVFELPESTRAKILAVYQSSFASNPNLVTMGSSVKLTDDPNCNLDTVAGIDAIATIQDQHKGSRFAFLTQEEIIKVIKLVKNDVSASSLYKLISRLDSTVGVKQNSGSTLTTLKMLLGVKPTKGRKSA